MNVGASSNPTNDITYPHSPHTSRDEDESLTRVTIDQLEKIDNEFENLQRWICQQYLDSEAIPLIIEKNGSSDKIGVDLLSGLAHIIDSNIMPIKSVLKSLVILNLLAKLTISFLCLHPCLACLHLHLLS